MKGADYSSRVFVGEGPEDSVHHVAQLAGVDEEHFARPVAEGGGSSASLLFRFGQEPDAGRYLRVGKELAGQGKRAFNKGSSCDARANVALGLTGRRGLGYQAFGCKHPRSRFLQKKKFKEQVFPRASCGKQYTRRDSNPQPSVPKTRGRLLQSLRRKRLRAIDPTTGSI
jgi:hypothetical protein